MRKRRFYCCSCRRPFTEPVPGVLKGYRTTQRYRASLLWACEHFGNRLERALAAAVAALEPRIGAEQLYALVLYTSGQSDFSYVCASANGSEQTPHCDLRERVEMVLQSRRVATETHRTQTRLKRVVAPTMNNAE